jgi:hypothetical protein
VAVAVAVAAVVAVVIVIVTAMVMVMVTVTVTVAVTVTVTMTVTLMLQARGCVLNQIVFVCMISPPRRVRGGPLRMPPAVARPSMHVRCGRCERGEPHWAAAVRWHQHCRSRRY